MQFWKGFVAGACAVGLGFGAGFFSRVSADPSILEVRAVRIVDKNGKVVGSFGLGTDDSLGLVIGKKQGASFLVAVDENAVTFGGQGKDKSRVFTSTGDEFGPNIVLVNNGRNFGAINLNKDGQIRLDSVPVSTEVQ